MTPFDVNFDEFFSSATLFPLISGTAVQLLVLKRFWSSVGHKGPVRFVSGPIWKCKINECSNVS